MTTMKRRDFLNAAAAAAGGAVLAARPALAQQTAIPPTPKLGWPSRPAKVEILFTLTGISANGLQCTEEGMWVIDNAESRGATPGHCKVYLLSYEGKRLRELSPESTGPSGISIDDDNRTIWCGSTYSREIIRADAKTGETIEKHFTPGAGCIYRRPNDVAPRQDAYAAANRPPAAAGARGRGAADGAARGGRQGVAPGQNSGQATADGLGVGRGGGITGNPGPPAPGTGAHGQQIQAGKLWMAVPPGRMIYRVDPKTWMVEHMFPSVGYRPHGIGIETPDAKYLWETDSNMAAFFKRDMVTGEVVDSIVIPDGSPFPHGASVWKGYIYWTTDTRGGPMSRAKI